MSIKEEEVINKIALWIYHESTMPIVEAVMEVNNE